MTNPIIRIHDLDSDEVIDREMTEEEYAAYLKVLEPEPLTNAEIETQEAKNALLAKLGISAEEAQLLFK